jgi:hypothetical protein
MLDVLAQYAYREGTPSDLRTFLPWQIHCGPFQQYHPSFLSIKFMTEGERERQKEE